MPPLFDCVPILSQIKITENLFNGEEDKNTDLAELSGRGGRLELQTMVVLLQVPVTQPLPFLVQYHKDRK